MGSRWRLFTLPPGIRCPAGNVGLELVGAQQSVNSMRSPMRSVAAIAVCIALSVTGRAIAGEQPRAGSAANTQAAATSESELHFVSVLTLRGEVVAIDPANRLVTLKSPTGQTTALEARNEQDLEPLKVGDHVLMRYFEGAQIGKYKQGEMVPSFSLKQGIITAKLGGPSAKKHALVLTVENVDVAEQEITLRGSDGSLETIMVANPEYLRHIKAGDRVGISHAQALALSLEKET